MTGRPGPSLEWISEGRVNEEAETACAGNLFLEFVWLRKHTKSRELWGILD